MKVIKNDKGFKIMAIDRATMAVKLNSPGICDSCMATPHIGYYVAVLNCWLCPDCFRDWYNNATNYPEDQAIETKYFNWTKQMIER